MTIAVDWGAKPKKCVWIQHWGMTAELNRSNLNQIEFMRVPGSLAQAVVSLTSDPGVANWFSGD